MSDRTSFPVDVLLVENEPGNIDLVRETLHQREQQVRLHVVSSGEDALSFLRCQWPYHQVPRPALILLDLKLPKKDGIQILAEIKIDSHLCHIPVIMLTTSDDACDIGESYAHQANCYVVKPTDASSFFEVMAGVWAFWLDVATLPLNWE